MKMLTIDTRNNQKVLVGLTIGTKVYEEASDSQNQRPESILNLIDKVCQKAGITIEEVESIHVEEGPGSYTGLKVGSSVANALSFALAKEVNGKKLGELVSPVYD